MWNITNTWSVLSCHVFVQCNTKFRFPFTVNTSSSYLTQHSENNTWPITVKVPQAYIPMDGFHSWLHWLGLTFPFSLLKKRKTIKKCPQHTERKYTKISQLLGISDENTPNLTSAFLKLPKRSGQPLLKPIVIFPEASDPCTVASITT